MMTPDDFKDVGDLVDEARKRELLTISTPYGLFDVKYVGMWDEERQAWTDVPK